MSVDKKLKELNLILPSAPAPLASYVPAVTAGHLVFVSGNLPMKEGKLLYSGKLGREVSLEQGVECARQTILNALANLKNHLGDLNRVRRVIRIGGFVASAEGFSQQPQVLNGASNLLVEIFGEKGRHARAAVGAAELPLNAPVEIELIVEVE